MEQVGNSQDRFGGEFMIQDRDHLGGDDRKAPKAKRSARQIEQSHAGDRQQGDGNDRASRRQGTRRHRDQ